MMIIIPQRIIQLAVTIIISLICLAIIAWFIWLCIYSVTGWIKNPEIERKNAAMYEARYYLGRMYPNRYRQDKNGYQTIRAYSCKKINDSYVVECGVPEAWRDAGALMLLYQLVTVALNIKSCPVGTLTNPFFSKLFFDQNKILSGGGMLLG